MPSLQEKCGYVPPLRGGTKVGLSVFVEGFALDMAYAADMPKGFAGAQGS
jgi:hypothetical protein